MANQRSRGSYTSERRADRRGWYPAAKLDLAVLYCAVGKREYELIETSGFRRFPRLPKQPYFYPVTSEESATLIARDWNMKDAASGRTGYVLRFRIRSEFLGITLVHLAQLRTGPIGSPPPISKGSTMRLTEC